MPETIATLLYGSAIDVEGLDRSVREARSKLNSLGNEATKIFDQKIANELARAVRPELLEDDVRKAKAILNSFRNDATRIFDRAFNREAARKAFRPFVDEATTFSGRIKAAIGESFSIKNIAGGFLAANVVASTLRGLFDITKASIELAKNAVETRNKFDVTFGALKDDVRDFANTYAREVGRSRVQTEDFLSTISGIFTTVGFAGEKAAEFSKNITKLTFDLASFFNTTDTEALTALRAGLIGESEPLRRFNVFLSEARVAQEALAQGINKTSKELTAADKVFLRYQIILKDTATAQGDAIRTADSLANQQKRLSANFSDLGEQLGSIFVPKLADATATINKFIEALTNKEFKEGVEALLNLAGLEFKLEDIGFGLGGLIGLGDKSKKVSADFIQAIDKTKGALIEQRDIITQAIEMQDKLNLGVVTVEAERKKINEKTTDDLEVIARLGGEQAEQAKEELKIRKDIEGVIESTSKQLALAAAVTPFERSLVEIEQRFDNLREQAHGNLIALKQIAILEEDAIAQSVDKILEASKKFIGEIRGAEGISRIIKTGITLQPEIDFKLPKTKAEIAEGVNEFDEQLRQLFRERNSFDLLADNIRNKITPIFAQVVTPVDEFLKKLEDSGIATRDEFVELADIFDRGLGNFVFALNDFVKRVSDPKGTILGSLIGGINLVSAAAPLLDKAFGRIVDSVIGGFTGSSYERKKAEAERRAQEASEAAAQAAQRAADALENLRREAEKFSAGELTNRLNALNEEFETLTNASTELTSSEQARALALVNEIKFLDVVIKGLEARLREATDPEDIANIRDQLNEAQEASNRAYAALGLLGININNLTAAELERIRIIVQETKIIEDAIKAFDAFGDGFRGFIDQLNLGFELLNIENPAIKLQELLRGLVDTFGFKVPKEFENLREFILGGFRALKNGGKELADFLIAAGLEEFTPEDFADLLKLLNEFSKVSEATTEAKNAFSDLVESLQLEFELLNVDDPIKKLERLRAQILKQFNAIIPETRAGLDELIGQGFLALQSGGDALKDFLTKFGLEELIGSTEAATRQQLEDLLRTLRGFANDLSGSLDDVGKQAEDLTISQVKSITYTQGNKFIDEITTIRIVVTQMLDQMRNSALATPNFGNLAAALTGLNNFAPQNNYYFINNGTLQRISENQLSDIDRRLIQQSRAASQAKGIN